MGKGSIPFREAEKGFKIEIMEMNRTPLGRICIGQWILGIGSVYKAKPEGIPVDEDLAPSNQLYQRPCTDMSAV